MQKKSSDSLGDRMKLFEQQEAGRIAFRQLPLMARLDGRAFHSFCRGLKRPFDSRFSDLMLETTKFLVDETQAKIGYVQSDEISLCWILENHEQEFLFNGKFQKLTSILAASATAFFNKRLSVNIPEKSHLLPVFDCRVWNVPTLKEAYHAILWRQQDATKNAISMAAHTYFSHKSLQGQDGPTMQERLWAEKGINFNDYPPFFKRGVFVKRRKVMKPLDPEQLARMPEEHRIAWSVPGTMVERTVIEPMDIWLSKEEDPLSILFGDGLPQGFYQGHQAAPGAT